jgi:hypothetical protein
LARELVSFTLALSSCAFALGARAEPSSDSTAVQAQVQTPIQLNRPRARSHRLGIAGASALAQAYTLGAWIAAGALIYCAASADADRGCTMKPTPGAFRELFIPLAGPWIALRRDDIHGDAKYALLFGALGSVQAAGLALLVFDLAVPRYEQRAWLRVVPVVKADTQLLTVTGAF